MEQYPYIEPYPLESGRFEGAYRFDAGGNSYLLNAESGCSMLLSRPLADRVADRQPGEALEVRLIQRGLIGGGELPRPVVRERVQPTFFIFDLTQACNFRCRYCFRHLEDKVTTISDDNLDAIASYIIRYCQRHSIRQFCIQPWGGEPLIAFDKIRRMDDAFRAAGLRPLISIETNASLITDELAAEASRRGIRIGVSVDGTPEVHNRQRPLLSGGDSFDKVRRGIETLRCYDNLRNFGAVCVLTSQSFPHLEEIVEFFGTELRLSCFKLNLIKDNPVMRDARLCLSEEQVGEAQRTLVRKLVELNGRGYAITELNVQEKLMNLLVRGKSNICTSRGCIGGTKMIAFDQEGRIYPCDVTDYKEEAIGSVHEERDLIELVAEAQAAGRDFFNPKRHDDCERCPFRFFCKGGCTTAIKYKLGRVEGVDRQECLANRSLYPELIHIILTNPQAVRGLTRGRVNLQ